MSDLRELTNAELDVVTGGARAIRNPTSCGGGENLGKDWIVHLLQILQILEGNRGCNSGPVKVKAD